MAVLLVKDWQDEERDAEGRWTSGGDSGQTSMEEASRNIADGAKAFRDAGGTVEVMSRDQSRATEAELGNLLRGLVSANGGNELSDRIMSGFRIATVAAGSARAIDSATIRVARTADGHIAAVCSSSPRPTLDPTHIELGLMGSTGITKGAGSALTEEVMKEASAQGLPVTLEALDDDAEHFWRGQMGASIASSTPGVPGSGLGWTTTDVKQLAAAA